MDLKVEYVGDRLRAAKHKPYAVKLAHRLDEVRKTSKLETIKKTTALSPTLLFKIQIDQAGFQTFGKVTILAGYDQFIIISHSGEKTNAIVDENAAFRKLYIEPFSQKVLTEEEVEQKWSLTDDGAYGFDFSGIPIDENKSTDFFAYFQEPVSSNDLPQAFSRGNRDIPGQFIGGLDLKLQLGTHGFYALCGVTETELWSERSYFINSDGGTADTLVPKHGLYRSFFEYHPFAMGYARYSPTLDVLLIPSYFYGYYKPTGPVTAGGMDQDQGYPFNDTVREHPYAIIQSPDGSSSRIELEKGETSSSGVIDQGEFFPCISAVDMRPSVPNLPEDPSTPILPEDPETRDVVLARVERGGEKIVLEEEYQDGWLERENPSVFDLSAIRGTLGDEFYIWTLAKYVRPFEPLKFDRYSRQKGWFRESGELRRCADAENPNCWFRDYRDGFVTDENYINRRDYDSDDYIIETGMKTIANDIKLPFAVSTDGKLSYIRWQKDGDMTEYNTGLYIRGELIEESGWENPFILHGDDWDQHPAPEGLRDINGPILVCKTRYGVEHARVTDLFSVVFYTKTVYQSHQDDELPYKYYNVSMSSDSPVRRTQIKSRTTFHLYVNGVIHDLEWKDGNSLYEAILREYHLTVKQEIADPGYTETEYLVNTQYVDIGYDKSGVEVEEENNVHLNRPYSSEAEGLVLVSFDVRPTHNLKHDITLTHEDTDGDGTADAWVLYPRFDDSIYPYPPVTDAPIAEMQVPPLERRWLIFNANGTFVWEVIPPKQGDVDSEGNVVDRPKEEREDDECFNWLNGVTMFGLKGFK